MTTSSIKPFIVKLTKRQQRAEANLSKAAQKTLHLIRNGRFYRWDGTPPAKVKPATIAELAKAGLIVPMPRAEFIRVNWVPVGTKPLRIEQLPSGYDYGQ